MTRTHLTLVAAAVTLAAACTSTHYVRIRHPLHVGQVDQNEVPFVAGPTARRRGLPSTSLVDRASLTEVTPERVCAHLSLWNLETNPDRGIYQNYSITLLNDQDGVEVSNAEVQLEQPVTVPMRGHVARRVPAGTRRVCANYRNRVCVRWRNQTIYRTIYEPHIYQVTNNPAQVCFPNGGFITPSTTRTAIEFQRVGASSRFVFEWQFDSAVASSPQGQQQQQQQ